ncbi:unnamed protein product [Phyllotreta striolata]|uniref:Cyclic GMP-AMP synthase-like n=1 Tax=Phyllotreta striolata TaxID=444603 RepID=A0A9N9TU93_PHYSR|nr:unnamed protein product [Phyllotreta striolata]
MADADDRRKYKPLENVLIRINRDIISLSDVEVRRNNAILRSLLEDILIPEMKEKDPLFEKLFTRVFYGGSFYDGLRVKDPNEFDLDLLLRLPKLSEPKLIPDDDVPGYTILKLNNLPAVKRHLYMLDTYRGISKFLLESEERPYLDNNKVRMWMERVVTRALNTFPVCFGQYSIEILQSTFLVKVHKSGPALTLKLRGYMDWETIVMDIDLVPCFEFDVGHMPVQKLLNRNFQKKTFFVVPKPMNNEMVPNNNRYWRLSYQEQERELMGSDRHQYLKPTIKLLKKLKEKEHPFIASYFIKTVVLLEAEEREDDRYWSTSLSYVFMTCLKKYHQYIERKYIPYYWNENYNLLQSMSYSALDNLKYRLGNIIRHIERNLEAGNPYIIQNYLLTDKELSLYKEQLPFYENENANIAEEPPSSSCIIL